MRGRAQPGTANKERQRALSAGKQVIEIDNSKQARLDDARFKVAIATDVKPLKQPTENSCWATVYTMMYAWKQHKGVTIEDALGVAGEKYVNMFKKDEALSFSSWPNPRSF